MIHPRLAAMSQNVIFRLQAVLFITTIAPVRDMWTQYTQVPTVIEQSGSNGSATGCFICSAPTFVSFFSRFRIDLL
jgi:hypothetical protein